MQFENFELVNSWGYFIYNVKSILMLSYDNISCTKINSQVNLNIIAKFVFEVIAPKQFK